MGSGGEALIVRRAVRVVQTVVVSLLVALASMALVVIAGLDPFVRFESCMPRVEVVDFGGQTGTSATPSCLALVPDPVPLFTFGILMALITVASWHLAGRRVHRRSRVRISV